MILINLFLLLLGSPDHDYHVGIYEVEVKENRFQISQKLFTDDFEKALKMISDDIVFNSDDPDDEFLTHIESYIRNHFSIRVDGQEVELDFLGAEWEEFHVVYLYWESASLDPFESFEIRNTIFYEVSSDQQNMHHIKFKEKKVSLLLEKDQPSGLVKGN